MGKKDIISKEAIKRIAVDLANILLKLNIDPDRLELLETEKQRIEDRRADLVARVYDQKTGDPSVLHIEIQNNNDPDMEYRMQRYYNDIRLSGYKETLCQYLIYIGKAPLTMPDGIDEPNMRYKYKILDMRQIDCDALLQQDTPDALVLAILCDFKNRPAQDVVHYIMTRINIPAASGRGINRIPNLNAASGGELNPTKIERTAQRGRKRFPALHRHAGNPIGEPETAGDHQRG